MRREICLELGRSLRPKHGPWMEAKTKKRGRGPVDRERERERERVREGRRFLIQIYETQIMSLGCAYVAPTYIVCDH